MRGCVLWRAPGRDLLGTQRGHKNECPCETAIHGCSESPAWESVLNDTDVPCEPRMLCEMKAPLHSQNHLLELASLEGRIFQLWRECCLPSAPSPSPFIFPPFLHFHFTLAAWQARGSCFKQQNIVFR